jgi:GT2 family glycosyltransferase
VTTLAVVLTFEAPHALAECLTALAAQERRPDAVLVVDNASSVPAQATVDELALDIEVRVSRQARNTGPAGGHAAGLQAFLASGAERAWVMDDDCVPEPACLARLLAAADAAPGPRLVFPSWVDDATGKVTNFPAWCGFVLDREIVAAVGLPREDFFWWAEDTEYLQWRIPEHGFESLRVDDAVVHHRRTRVATMKPAWKIYYEVRNTLYFRIYVQRFKWSRVRRLFRTLARTLARIVLREDDKARKLRMYGRGVVDGLTRKLGHQVAVPTVASTPFGQQDDS